MTAQEHFNEGFQSGDGAAVHRGRPVALDGQHRNRKLFFNDDIFNLSEAERLDIVDDAINLPSADLRLNVSNSAFGIIRIGIGKILAGQIMISGTGHAELSLDLVEYHFSSEFFNDGIKIADNRRDADDPQAEG